MVAAVLSSFLNTGNTSSNFCSSQFTSQQKYTCLESIAITSNNSTACSSLPGSYKDNCYAQIAAQKSNIQLCGVISNSTLQAECTTNVANSTGDYNYCMQLSQPYNDKCLYAIGTNKASMAACSSIANTTLSQTCSYSIDFTKALEYKNSSYCSSIGNGTSSQSYAILNSTQFSGANSIGNLAIIVYYYDSYLNLKISPKDMCYYSLAYTYGGSSYCSGISNSTLGTMCLKSYSINATLNGTTYYENLSSLCAASGQVSCPYISLIKAIYSKNVTACKSLNTSEGATCFASLASYYSNSSYCQYISNATLNNACVESILYKNSTNG